MHVSNEPFVGEPTSKVDFPRWSAKPAESVKPQHTTAPTGPDTRDFATSSALAFNDKGVVARQPAIPFTSHVFSNDEDRDFRTEHAAHFQSPPPAEACPSEALVNQVASVSAAVARGQLPSHALQSSTRVVGGHLLYEKRGGRYQPAEPKGPPGRIRF
jgi:hypothetical protein